MTRELLAGTSIIIIIIIIGTGGQRELSSHRLHPCCSSAISMGGGPGDRGGVAGLGVLLAISSTVGLELLQPCAPEPSSLPVC